MQEHPRLLALERELTYAHYLPSKDNPVGDYSWDGLDIDKVARRHKCHAKQVRETMKKIEKRFPKPAPKPTKDAELAEKAPTGDTCQRCGHPIVWIGQTACNPPILDGVSADERKGQFRQIHTCPQVWRGGSGVEAAAGE